MQDKVHYTQNQDEDAVMKSAPGVSMATGQQVLRSGEELGLSTDGQEGGEGATVGSRQHH